MLITGKKGMQPNMYKGKGENGNHAMSIRSFHYAIRNTMLPLKARATKRNPRVQRRAVIVALQWGCVLLWFKHAAERKLGGCVICMGKPGVGNGGGEWHTRNDRV